MCQHLPVLVLAVTLVLELVLGIGEDTAMASVALVLSWAFLRFWQPRGESRGDWRDEFAFAAMFPEAMRPPVEALSRVVYSVLGGLWFFKEPAVPPPPLPTGVQHHTDVEAAAAPKVVDPVAERRRQRALKALNSRMASMETRVSGRSASTKAAAPAPAVAAAATAAPAAAPAPASAPAPAPSQSPTAPASTNGQDGSAATQS